MVGITVILALLPTLVHVPHLMRATSGTSADVTPASGEANESTVHCPPLRWTSTPDDQSRDLVAAPLRAECDMIWADAISADRATPFVIPVARGPDMQAALQRFTL